MSAAAEFQQLYEDWFRAIEQHDRDWFERTITDDFVELLFLKNDDGSPHIVQLGKQEFVTLDMLIADSAVKAIAVDAVVVGDLATSWLLADDRITLSAAATAEDRAILDKVGFKGDVSAALDQGMRALYCSAWRRAPHGWTCFSHQLLGVVA